jgi:hypothetical protein
MFPTTKFHNLLVWTIKLLLYYFTVKCWQKLILSGIPSIPNHSNNYFSPASTNFWHNSTFPMIYWFNQYLASYLEVPVIQQARVYTTNWENKLQQQPQYNVDHLRLTKQVEAIFDAEHSLSEHYGTIDPALSSHTPASTISHIGVILPENTDGELITMIQ